MKNKGVFYVFIVIFSILFSISSISMADSLDTEYLTLLFNKFESYDEEIKVERKEILQILMATEDGLDILFHKIITAKKDSLVEYGITEKKLEKNFSILKNWSAEDRLALVEAGASGDKALIYEIINECELDDKRVQRMKKLEENGLRTKQIPIIEEYKNKKFVDTKNHWSNEYVLFLARRGIVNGRTFEDYYPNDSISRAEIVKIITKIIVEDENKKFEYEGEIRDIETGKWYDKYMRKGYSLGLIVKDERGNLSPEYKPNKEEVAEIIINTLIAMEIEIPEDLKIYKGNYEDFDLVTKSRQEAMVLCINLGIINGTSEYTIDPMKEITRGEIAAVVERMYIYIYENNVSNLEE